MRAKRQEINPSGLLSLASQAEKHWSSSGEDSAFVQRRRGFESHPVLFVLSQPNTPSAHDVAVACCLAMAEARVRLPLGASTVTHCESIQTLYDGPKVAKVG